MYAIRSYYAKPVPKPLWEENIEELPKHKVVGVADTGDGFTLGGIILTTTFDE